MHLLKILVIGNGGREHALAWRLSLSTHVHTVYVCPGNAGTATEPKVVNIPQLSFLELIDFVKKEHIDFTVVGPEAPLSEGIVDQFQAHNLHIFGPTQSCARLESSKVFAKTFMNRHNIPTAQHAVFTDAKQAHAYIESNSLPIVIKADFLAAGKGVVVAEDKETAHKAIDSWLTPPSLLDNVKDKPPSIVIESFLKGEELSFIVLVDGTHILPLATSQDHKRLLEGDLGPNTGGMGAYSPVPGISEALKDKILKTIIEPAVSGMAEEGNPYKGFLYAGLMITEDGAPWTLEFNCRLGDPEAQVILARIGGDLSEIMQHAIAATLNQVTLTWDTRYSVGIVIAAQGYPMSPQLGGTIQGLSGAGSATGQANELIFHAGTQLSDDKSIKTSGGRVVCCTALGDSLEEAQTKALIIAEKVRFEGSHYRKDIGFHGLKKSLNQKEIKE